MAGPVSPKAIDRLGVRRCQYRRRGDRRRSSAQGASDRFQPSRCAAARQRRRPDAEIAGGGEITWCPPIGRLAAPAYQRIRIAARTFITRAMWSCSKIQIVRGRHRHVAAQFIRIFGADNFRPLTQRAPISYGSRPGHREGVFVLDREGHAVTWSLVPSACRTPNHLAFRRCSGASRYFPIRNACRIQQHRKLLSRGELLLDNDAFKRR